MVPFQRVGADVTSYPLETGHIYICSRASRVVLVLNDVYACTCSDDNVVIARVLFNRVRLPILLVVS